MLQQQHSFGGRALDRYVYEFEPEGDSYDDVPAGGGEAAADADVEVGAAPSAEAEPGAEATAEVAGAPSPAETAAPTWAPSREEWEDTQQALATFARIEQQRQEEAAAAARGDEPTWDLDPIENDNFATDLQSFLRHTIQETIQPLTGTVAQVQAKEAQATIDQLLDGIKDVDGYTPDQPLYEGGPSFRDGTRELAAAFVDQVKAEQGIPADRPGGPRVAQEAMRRAATMLGQMAKAQHTAGRDAYKAEMEALKNAPATPAVTGGGVEGLSPTDDYDEALRRMTGSLA